MLYILSHLKIIFSPSQNPFHFEIVAKVSYFMLLFCLSFLNGYPLSITSKRLWVVIFANFSVGYSQVFVWFLSPITVASFYQYFVEIIINQNESLYDFQVLDFIWSIVSMWLFNISLCLHYLIFIWFFFQFSW